MREAQRRAACPGGDAGAAAQHGEDQRGAGGSGRARKPAPGLQPDAERAAAPDTDAMAPRRLAARRRSRLRTRLEARRSLSGVRKGQCIRAEGAEGAGADRGAGAAGGHGVFAGAAALQRLRAGVHGRRAGRSGSGKVRRDGGGDDRAAQVRQRSAVPPVGTTGRATGDSVAGGDAVGDRGGSGGVDQAGAG